MTHPLSLLVDGDNISGKHAGEIFSLARRYGEPQIARVYANAQCNSEWHGADGYRMMHAGTGKNAADILLAMDAMELLLSQSMLTFVVASSDGDFSHLATRLREHGATVIGVGETKAPCAFRACCAEFIEIETTIAAPQPPNEKVASLDHDIRSTIATNSKQGMGMRLADLASKMHKQHGIRISSRPERSWRSYLLARPELYDLDPRGPEAMVRFRPEGFF